MKQHNCDLLCTNKATRRVGKLFLCDSCAGPPENQCGTSPTFVTPREFPDPLSSHPADDARVIDKGALVSPTIPSGRHLYSAEDLADARHFLSNLRPRTSWDGDEEEFMANAARRLYNVRFVGRFAQRVHWAIATYHARVEKAQRLARTPRILPPEHVPPLR
jgi:hypothetical protein